MKNLLFLFSAAIIISCTTASEKTYTGSTPAAAVIRPFLGIALTDSVDFIRWKIILRNNEYELQANYGIGKQNTNGFINGGKKITLTGTFTKEKNRLLLQNGNTILKLVQLNDNLLHLLDDDNSLLNGTGGFSYTLNNMNPVSTDEINITFNKTALKDSIAYQGRTPCNVPGLTDLSPQCNKIKWYIVLYANTAKDEPGRYRIFAVNWRKNGGKIGSWKMVTGKNGRIIYQLNDDDGTGLIYLLKLDANILVFTDAAGNLLVGDEDFSYTLNRK